MFSLGIRYLMGWAMAAADGAKKEQPEWPPHPDRVFMALAAAWFETGQNADEGEALRWLEMQPAPAIAASGHHGRQLVTHYVPVNDPALSTAKTIQGLAAKADAPLPALKDAGLSQLPEYRSRQPRSFPVALPHDLVVHFIWEGEVPEAHREPLQAICRKVGAIGHSPPRWRRSGSITHPRSRPGVHTPAWRRCACGCSGRGDWPIWRHASTGRRPSLTPNWKNESRTARGRTRRCCNNR